MWDRLFTKPKISDNKHNSRYVARLKREGRKAPEDMITEQQAVQRSWRAYSDWIEH